MSDDIKDEDNVRVIRIRLDRVGATLLLIVSAVYAGMSVGWLGALGFIPALVYQWKYYMTYDDCVRLSEILSDASDAVDTLKEINNIQAKRIRHLEGGDNGDSKK